MKKLRIALLAITLATTAGCVTPPLVTDVRTEQGRTVATKTRYIPMVWWWIKVSTEDEVIDE